MMKMLCYSFRKAVLVAAEASLFFSRRSIPGKSNPLPFISMEAAQSKCVISKFDYLFMSIEHSVAEIGFESITLAVNALRFII